jgi:hypothetical protein
MLDGEIKQDQVDWLIAYETLLVEQGLETRLKEPDIGNFLVHPLRLPCAHIHYIAPNKGCKV